jgi:hypothetical protein
VKAGLGKIGWHTATAALQRRAEEIAADYWRRTR